MEDLNLKTISDWEEPISNIRNELKKYIQDNKIKSLILGVSGGIDSALCAVLANPVCHDLGIKLIGRSIPITGNKEDERDRAEAIGEIFCDNFEEVYLNEEYENIWGRVEPEGWDLDEDEQIDKFRKGNIKARLRMICLYDLAQLHRGMVLSTDNKTEYLLGFWTLHGDVGDYGMIQDLWKTEVYNLSEWLVNNELKNNQLAAKALNDCIVCQATDGLGITNTDLDQLMPGWNGTSRDGYAIVDQRLIDYYNHVGLDPQDPIILRNRKSHFKRVNPVNILRSTIFQKTKINSISL